jgi:REP element-mobilizing transposase RayT
VFGRRYKRRVTNPADKIRRVTNPADKTNAGLQTRPTTMATLPHRLRRLGTVFRQRASDRVVFFVTMCTAQRRPLLANAPVHEAFRTFCCASLDMADVVVGKYVLMPDHVHVFVSAYGSKTLSRWVGSLKKYLGKQWRERGLHAPFWQTGFFDHVLRGHESYVEKAQYVLDNPVRKGLVVKSEDWPYAGEITEIHW